MSREPSDAWIVQKNSSPRKRQISTTANITHMSKWGNSPSKLTDGSVILIKQLGIVDGVAIQQGAIACPK